MSRSSPFPKSKSTQIFSDQTLNTLEKNHAFNIKISTQNHVHNVMIAIIYVFPILIFVLGLSLVVHWYLVADWIKLETALTACLSLLVGYVARYLQTQAVLDQTL